MIKLRYLSEKEFCNRLKRIQDKNIQKERLEILKKEKNKLKPKQKFKLPSTSKIILLAVSLLCLEIIIFCEYIMITFQDTSSMYVLIGVPVSLIPVVLGYYHKSMKENTVGGIVYDSVISQSENYNNISTDSLDNAEG